jgi:hypothetical protein
LPLVKKPSGHHAYSDVLIFLTYFVTDIAININSLQFINKAWTTTHLAHHATTSSFAQFSG